MYIRKNIYKRCDQGSPPSTYVAIYGHKTLHRVPYIVTTFYIGQHVWPLGYGATYGHDVWQRIWF